MKDKIRLKCLFNNNEIEDKTLQNSIQDFLIIKKATLEIMSNVTFIRFESSSYLFR